MKVPLQAARKMGILILTVDSKAVNLSLPFKVTYFLMFHKKSESENKILRLRDSFCVSPKHKIIPPILSHICIHLSCDKGTWNGGCEETL